LANGETELRKRRGDFRQTILDATRRIIDERGLQAATTRNIAELAGCAEGTIYRHFEDKHELFLELFAGSSPEFLDLVAILPSQAGGPPVRETLTRVGRAALHFYRAVLPFVGGGIVDTELREQQRAHFNRPGHGPGYAFEQLENYLEAERQLGRIGTSGSPVGATRALLGAAFGRAYLDVWLGEELMAKEAGDEQYMAEVVGTLLEGLRPRDE
jgi:AcrR family transcriptional regulator